MVIYFPCCARETRWLHYEGEKKQVLQFYFQPFITIFAEHDLIIQLF